MYRRPKDINQVTNSLKANEYSQVINVYICTRIYRTGFCPDCRVVGSKRCKFVCGTARKREHTYHLPIQVIPALSLSAFTVAVFKHRRA